MTAIQHHLRRLDGILRIVLKEILGQNYSNVRRTFLVVRPRFQDRREIGHQRRFRSKHHVGLYFGSRLGILIMTEENANFALSGRTVDRVEFLHPVGKSHHRAQVVGLDQLS